MRYYYLLIWLFIGINFCFSKTSEKFSVHAKLSQLDSVKTAEEHINIGNKNSRNNQFDNAIKNYLTAIKLLEKNKDSSKLALVYTNIGVINAKLKNFDKAIKYLESSLDYIGNNESQKLRTLYNISAMHYDNENIRAAIEKGNQAELLAKKINDKKTLSAIYSTYCNIYRDLKDYNTSIENGKKSLELKQELKLNPDITINNIGYSYLLSGNNRKAIEYFIRIKNTSSKPLKLLVFNNLRKAYGNLNQNELALSYSDKLIALKDLLNSEQQSVKVAELIEKYEADKKQQEINLLNAENELQESRLENQKYLFIGVGFVTLLIGLLSYLWYKNQKTNQSLQQASLQHKLLQTQLNPHFIFHSLNSIQSFIFQNKKDESINYLSNYSKLMRSIFDSTSVDFITVEEDADAIKAYLELQRLNFENDVNFSIEMEKGIEDYQIPPMIVQPYVENAIQHGIKNINKGKVSVTYKQYNDLIEILIIDNGTGLKSKNNTSLHKYSTSSEIIKKRIENLSKVHKYHIKSKVEPNDHGGTTVKLYLPKKQ